jgi:hypothetical protein
LNEILVQRTKFENAITADSNNPTIYFPSGAHRGQNINTPQTTNQEKNQFKDDFSFTRNLFGRTNNFKVGVSYIDEPTLGGDFSTGLAAGTTSTRTGTWSRSRSTAAFSATKRRSSSTASTSGRPAGQRPADRQPRLRL